LCTGHCARAHVAVGVHGQYLVQGHPAALKPQVAQQLLQQKLAKFQEELRAKAKVE
jgi:hypothetical protein